MYGDFGTHFSPLHIFVHSNQSAVVMCHDLNVNSRGGVSENSSRCHMRNDDVTRAARVSECNEKWQELENFMLLFLMSLVGPLRA